MCDTIAAVSSATAHGGILFGKNSDRPRDEAQYLQHIAAKDHKGGTRVQLTHVEIPQVSHTYAVLLSKPHWIWGAEIGTNENGLCIGNEAVFPKVGLSSQPGIIGMDYLRLALERARDVDEAVEVITTLLGQYGQSGKCALKHSLTYDNSFILADSNGAKVLETSDRDWVTRTIVNHYAISNAMTVDDAGEAASSYVRSLAYQMRLNADRSALSFREYFEDPSKVASGEFRRARAMEMLGDGAGALDVPLFFKILRDHVEGPLVPGRAQGPRICAHAVEGALGQTTASWVSSILRGRPAIHWVTATSTPCLSLFKPVILENELPVHGPLPGEHEDRVSLWWRHEMLRRWLDTVDAEVRDAYIQERDQYESSFIERMSAELSASAATRCWTEAMAFEERWLQRAELNDTTNGLGVVDKLAESSE